MQQTVLEARLQKIIKTDNLRRNFSDSQSEGILEAREAIPSALSVASPTYHARIRRKFYEETEGNDELGQILEVFWSPPDDKEDVGVVRGRYCTNAGSVFKRRPKSHNKVGYVCAYEYA